MTEILDRPKNIQVLKSRIDPHQENDQSVITSIEILRQELDDLHNRFNQATEPMLIESIVYEMQAVQLRYVYYLNLCKERGLVSETLVSVAKKRY